MRIRLEGNCNLISAGMKALQKEYQFMIASDSPFTLHCKQSADMDVLTVDCKETEAVITYSKTHHFFRGFGVLLEQLQQGNNQFTLEETPQFNTVGPMVDLSRNGVLNEDSFRKLIRILAMMGFNAAMLYMEDTYEVKTEPYFGYMRGRYSKEELQRLDDYADQFGIELIPCIQTLAHLEEFLKWDDAYKYKDTRGALLLESEPTYDLLTDMISSVSSAFRSKRIHIGMDEAEEVGRGRYLNLNGHKDRFILMKNHLERVLNITDSLDLEVTMWSDMFLKLASKTGDVYSKDTEIPAHIVDQTPRDVQLMYWQYNSGDKEHYEKILKQHKSFHKQPAFAGGVWIWNTFGVNYHLSQPANEAALHACKQEGINDVFVTLWGDDGQETTPFHALLGLQYYAEHAYTKGAPKNNWQSRVKFCTGIKAEAFAALSKLDRPPGTDLETTDQTNPSKFLLWQDALLGVFDKHIEGLPVGDYYKQLHKEIQALRNKHQELDFLFEVPEKLCHVLELKAAIGSDLKTAYDNKDHETLQAITEKVLPEIIDRVDKLREMHRNQWFKVNKPFGFEVIDIRYGGLVNRIDTAIARLTDYLNGSISKIEELEADRLYYSPAMENASTLGWCSYYYRMASPNVFFHVLPIY